MKYAIFILFYILKLNLVFAAAHDFVVKVESFPCEYPQIKKIGSGNLIQFRGQNYVLTSDHVVFHGNKSKGICHTVANKHFNSPAEFVGAHAGKGLAVLQIAQTKPYAISLNSNVIVSSMQSVALAGFPLQSNTVLYNEGLILNAQSSRHILPLVKTFIEVKAHSEYGMSGGALIDTGTGQFLGLLSHQYLELRLGQSSVIKNYNDAQASAQFIALVVPSEEIISWLIELVNKKPSSQLIFNVDHQILNKESLVIEGVEFSKQNCAVKNDLNKKIGGSTSDGAGIGGATGDGAGIGGSGQYSKDDLCEIFTRWVGEDVPQNHQSWSFNKGSIWFQKLKQKLLSGGSISISGVYINDTFYGVGQNLIHFFNLLEIDGIPVATINTAFRSDKKIELSVVKLQTDFKELQKEFTNPSSVELKDLILQIKMTINLLNNQQYELASSERIKKLIEHVAWGKLIGEPNVSFEKIVEIKSQLMRLDEQLKSIRL